MIARGLAHALKVTALVGRSSMMNCYVNGVSWTPIWLDSAEGGEKVHIVGLFKFGGAYNSFEHTSFYAFGF